jgi:hypothetical protein
MSNILKKLFQRKTKPVRMKNGFQDIINTPYENALLTTLTGEPLQLARIHFVISHQDGVIHDFEKMKCMAYDDNKQRWVWHYDNESKRLSFTTRRKDLPKNIGSIVLGSFYLLNAEHMYLDVNSFDRAITAIQFFAQHLSRENAILSHIQIVNKCFQITQGMLPPDHNNFLDPLFPDEPDEDEFTEELFGDTSLDKEEKLLRFQQQIQENLRKPLSPVESLPIHFYTDGIEGLQGGLKMRHIIALKNWAGDEKFTFIDIFQQMLPENDWQNMQDKQVERK